MLGCCSCPQGCRVSWGQQDPWDRGCHAMEVGGCAMPCPVPCLCGCTMPGYPYLHLVTCFPSADVGPRQKPASSPHGETLTGTEMGSGGNANGPRPWGAVGQRRHPVGRDGDGGSYLGAPQAVPVSLPAGAGVPASPSHGAEASFSHRSALSRCCGTASAPAGSSWPWHLSVSSSPAAAIPQMLELPLSDIKPCVMMLSPVWCVGQAEHGGCPPHRSTPAPQGPAQAQPLPH